MYPRLRALVTAATLCRMLLLSCTQETPNSPVDSEPFIDIPPQAPVIAYSVMHEWSSDVHLNVYGTDTETSHCTT